MAENDGGALVLSIDEVVELTGAYDLFKLDADERARRSMEWVDLLRERGEHVGRVVPGWEPGGGALEDALEDGEPLGFTTTLERTAEPYLEHNLGRIALAAERYVLCGRLMHLRKQPKPGQEGSLVRQEHEQKLDRLEAALARIDGILLESVIARIPALEEEAGL